MAEGNAAPTAPSTSTTSTGAAARPGSFKSHVANVGETAAPAEVSGGGSAPATDTPQGPRPQRPVGRVAQQPAQQPQPAAPANDNALPEVDEPPLEGDTDPGFDEPIDPMESELHGMKVRDLLEALAEGLIPDALLDKLEREFDVNGNKRRRKLNEWDGDQMRQADYSRKMSEVKRAEASAQQLHQQAQGFIQAQRQMHDGWKQGPEGVKAFRRDMRRMGLGNVFVQAAQQLAEEMHGFSNLHPDAQPFARQQKLQQEAAEDLEWQQQQHRVQMQRADQQRALQQRSDAYKQQLGELVPAAMQRHGLKDFKVSPLTRTIFTQTLDAHWDPGKALTPELIDEVAASTKMQLEEMALSEQGQGPATTATNGAAPAQGNGYQPTTPSRQAAGNEPLSPRRMPGAAGAAAPKQKQMRPKDFKAYLKQRQGKR